MRGLGAERSVAAIVIVAALVGACGPRPTASEPGRATGSPATSAAASATPPGPAGGFAIGLEYGVPGLLEMAASTGAVRAKPALEFAVWGNIEPRQGERDWGPLDGLIAEHQAAGLVDLQLLIAADSPWASRTPKRDPMPREAHLDEYAAFVTAFVERYDGDGLEDAPGLLAGIHEYGVEREFTGFWGSSAEDYLTLLGIAAPAIRAADPSAEVLLVAIMAIDVFDGAPDAAEIERRWATDRPYRKSLEETVAILSACERFDAVDVHGLGDATELGPTLDWVRARLAEAGCPDRPIWIGDAFPMSPLRAFDARPFHPATRSDLAAVSALLDAAADPGSSGHDDAVAWLRAEMARGVVRKLALAASAGAAGINIGNLEDWTTGLVPADRLLVVGAGTAILGGIADTRRTNQRPHGGLPYEGDGFAFSREVTGLRPAHAALALAIPVLDGATRAERLDVGDPTAWVIRLETPAGTVYVAWADDGRVHLPGDDGPSLTVTVDVPTGTTEKARIPTVSDDPVGWEGVIRTGPTLTLTLDRTPVLVVVDG